MSLPHPLVIIILFSTSVTLSVFLRARLEILVGEHRYSLYPWLKTDPSLSGMVFISHRMCSFRRGAPGVVREGGANLASQISWISPAYQWADRCRKQPSHSPSVFLTCGLNNCRFLRILCSCFFFGSLQYCGVSRTPLTRQGVHLLACFLIVLFCLSFRLFYIPETKFMMTTIKTWKDEYILQVMISNLVMLQ